MKTYIWKTHKGYYVEFPEEIDEQYWAGQIGTTYEDFLNGKWVLLSDEQVAFHNEHKYASIREVLNIALMLQIQDGKITYQIINNQVNQETIQRL